jgi:hypothetical protein
MAFQLCRLFLNRRLHGGKEGVVSKIVLQVGERYRRYRFEANVHVVAARSTCPAVMLSPTMLVHEPRALLTLRPVGTPPGGEAYLLALEARVVALEATVQQLRAQLQLDSCTSSSPPSSDPPRP